MGIPRPGLLVRPRDDDLTPWQQAERTCKALRAEGVNAELVTVEGVAHLFDLDVAGQRRGLRWRWATGFFVGEWKRCVMC